MLSLKLSFLFLKLFFGQILLDLYGYLRFVHPKKLMLRFAMLCKSIVHVMVSLQCKGSAL